MHRTTSIQRQCTVLREADSYLRALLPPPPFASATHLTQCYILL